MSFYTVRCTEICSHLRQYGEERTSYEKRPDKNLDDVAVVEFLVSSHVHLLVDLALDRFNISRYAHVACCAVFATALGSIAKELLDDSVSVPVVAVDDVRHHVRGALVERSSKAEVLGQFDSVEEREGLGVGDEDYVFTLAVLHDSEPLLDVVEGVEVAAFVDADDEPCLTATLALLEQGQDHPEHEVIPKGCFVVPSPAGQAFGIAKLRLLCVAKPLAIGCCKRAGLLGGEIPNRVCGGLVRH